MRKFGEKWVNVKSENTEVTVRDREKEREGDISFGVQNETTVENMRIVAKKQSKIARRNVLIYH